MDLISSVHFGTPKYFTYFNVTFMDKFIIYYREEGGAFS
jgi:hypothetical protein